MAGDLPIKGLMLKVEWWKVEAEKKSEENGGDFTCHPLPKENEVRLELTSLLSPSRVGSPVRKAKMLGIFFAGRPEGRR